MHHSLHWHTKSTRYKTLLKTNQAITTDMKNQPTVQSTVQLTVQPSDNLLSVGSHQRLSCSYCLIWLQHLLSGTCSARNDASNCIQTVVRASRLYSKSTEVPHQPMYRAEWFLFVFRTLSSKTARRIKT